MPDSDPQNKIDLEKKNINPSATQDKQTVPEVKTFRGFEFKKGKGDEFFRINKEQMDKEREEFRKKRLRQSSTYDELDDAAAKTLDFAIELVSMGWTKFRNWFSNKFSKK